MRRGQNARIERTGRFRILFCLLDTGLALDRLILHLKQTRSFITAETVFKHTYVKLWEAPPRV
jgi:hypothetical protein